ncbi:MAG: CHAT domain-containing protein [Acidobacteriota bacterium]|nr:CHAT domain-containing protein [Acidobacteriota bacterium]
MFCLCGLPACGPFPSSSKQVSEEQVLAEVTRVIGSQRLVLPRLSGVFSGESGEVDKHAPVRRVPDDIAVFLGVEADIDDLLRRAPSPRMHRVKAVLQLLTVKGVDGPVRALDELGSARYLKPQDPHTLNDLAAAFFIQAHEENRPFNFLLALQTIDDALELDPLLPEALFNRALFLEHLYLRKAADAAWQACLAEDTASVWAAEARERQRENRRILENRVVEPLTQRFQRLDLQADLTEQPRSLIREGFERILLEKWADAVTDGDITTAKMVLGDLERIGRTLAGDPLYRETAASLGRVMNGDSTNLAQAMSSFSRGVETIKSEDFDKAAALLEDSIELLAAANHPFLIRALHFRAVVEFRRPSSQEAYDRFQQILEMNQVAANPNLMGEILWHMGYLEMAWNQFNQAKDTFERAVANFESAGEWVNEIGLINFIGDLYLPIGDYETAWDYYYRSLSGTDSIWKPRRLFQIFINAAVLAWDRGMPEIALLYHKETHDHALAGKEPPAIGASYTWRARFHAALGSWDEARKDLVEASRSLPAGGKQNQTLRDLVEGEIALQQDPLKAREMLAAAAGSYQENKLFYPLADALFTLGRAHRELSDESAARETIARSLQLYEDMREGIEEEASKVILFYKIGEIFDEMIDLQLRHGDPYAALDYLESRRARVLLDNMAGMPESSQALNSVFLAKPLPWETWRRQLPEDGETGILVYQVSGQQLSAWIADRRDVQHFYLSSPSLQFTIDELRRRLEKRKPRWRVPARQLYRELIQPLESDLIEYRRLVIVPDGVLHALPFGTLYDGGQYLLEKKQLSVAPSANFFLRCLARDEAMKDVLGQSVLVLGNPAHDPERFPGLPDLTSSEEEARRVFEELGGEGTLLLGAKAGEADFLAHAGSSRVIHFAGHARSRMQNPGTSYMVLAPGDEHDGTLHAYELGALNLPNTRLVVLSACETALNPTFDAEGGGLVPAFLAAGVPAVVASLWEVPDDLTRDLMVPFYQKLKEGLAPIDALHQVQRDMIKVGDPPQVWAAFQLIGHTSTLD